MKRNESEEDITSDQTFNYYNLTLPWLSIRRPHFFRIGEQLGVRPSRGIGEIDHTP